MICDVKEEPASSKRRPVSRVCHTNFDGAQSCTMKGKDHVLVTIVHLPNAIELVLFSCVAYYDASKVCASLPRIPE
jgi:hypothetical protein